MKSKALSMALTAAIVAASTVATPASAGEIFGTTGQGHFVPAYEFTPISENCTLAYHSWYYYVSRDSGAGTCTNSAYRAQLRLPEGALVASYAMFAYDNSASNLSTGIQDNYATYGTTATVASYDTLANSTVTTAGASTNYQLLLANGINKTIDSYIASSVHHDYALTLSLPKDENLRFRGAWIFWFRQIAPAPASATFTDVPTSHPFFNEVQQLVKSGVTLGCGGANYCPDAAVTRGQMAAFLSRSLGLHWSYTTDAP